MLLLPSDSHFLPPLFVEAFFAGDFTLFGFTLFTGAFFTEAATFFGAGLEAGAFFPVDVLAAFAGGFGFAAAFGLAAAALGLAAAGLGFAATVLVLEAAFGLAAALAFGFGFAAGLAFETLAVAVALGLGLDFAATGFFFDGEDEVTDEGLVAGESLKEPLTLASFPEATFFFKW